MFCEALGAGLIVLAGCGAVTADQLSGGAISHVGVALTFGLVMAMIYTVGHVSGAHFNPAVTLAFAATRHFPSREVLPYMIAQCGGAIIGAGILQLTLASILAQMDPAAVLNLGVTQPLGGAFSTALIWGSHSDLCADVRDHGCCDGLSRRRQSCRYGYRCDGRSRGDVCWAYLWASMNPARSLGPAMIAGQWDHIMAYVIGPMLGALAGALSYLWVRADEPVVERDNSIIALALSFKVAVVVLIVKECREYPVYHFFIPSSDVVD